MKFFRFLLILTILIFTSCNSRSRSDYSPLIIGTFNISWLGDGINDEIPRTNADYQRIAGIIKNLNPDIMALQEIENSNAIKRVLKYLDGYKFIIATDRGKQNECIIYNNSIEISPLGEYKKLIVELYKTRPGLLAKVKKGNFDFIMMDVHFKSTSRFDSTSELVEISKEERLHQAKIISAWTDSILRIGQEKDLIILGDFNDYPNRINEPTLTPIAENLNLTFLTNGLKSCKNPILYGIDHIVVSKTAAKRYIANTLRIYDIYSSLPDSEIEKVSDHCPIVIQFEVKSQDNN
jgi:endonuclease/exonuclease/phosphatase family metal-dependent hydrolase